MKFLITTLLFLSGWSSFAQVQQKLFYSKQSTVIQINPLDNSFSQDIHIKGICPPHKKQVLHVYYGELDQIKDFKAYYTNAKQKRKSIKKKQITRSSALTSSFYSGVEKLSFFYEPQDQAFPFEYKYIKTTSDLMFLSSFTLYQQASTDTFYYELILPETHHLSYTIDSSYLDVFTVQVQERAQAKHYIFSSNLQQRQALKKNKRPSVRLLVHTKDQEPEDYFNDWYAKLVQPHSHLSQESFEELTTAISPALSAKEKIATVFNFIKEKIHYIDFENGIGAVQPRDVNQILTNKQGDCKDMSNLLCQTLKQLGYEAYIAISSTLSHPYDLTFPSLASANHAICVVKLEKEWLFLDATEDYGIFGFPSKQIQDKHIFIINEDKGLLKKVEKVPATENAVIHNIQLHQQDNSLIGKASYLYHGLSQVDLQFLKNYTSQEKVHSWLSEHIEEKCSNTKLTELDILNKDSTTQINYTCAIKKVFTNIGQKTYLSLAFLPLPHDDPLKISKKKNYLFYETQRRQLSLKISLAEESQLRAFEAIDFAENGFRFQLNIKQIAAKELQLNYLYENQHVKLRPDLVDSYNKLNQIIQESLQKSIIYEKTN